MKAKPFVCCQLRWTLVWYLREGVNGVMTSGSAPEYAQCVLALINDQGTLAQLRAASLADADVYTLEKMVSRFADGIALCLGQSLPNE